MNGDNTINVSCQTSRTFQEQEKLENVYGVQLF